MQLTVISPAKNEAGNLPELIRRTFATAVKHHLRLEFLLVDDHSTDATRSVIAKLKKTYPDLKLIKSKGFGPGAALITGFTQAGNDTVITLDSDLSHEPEVIPSFLKRFQKNKSDLLIGARFIPGGSADLPSHRLFFSRLAAFLVSLLTSHHLGDATSGFRVQKLSVIRKLKLESPGFPIHLEIPLKAILSGFKVDEHPIHYRKRKHGSSKMRTFRVGPGYLRVLFEQILKYNLAFLFQTENSN